MNAWVFAGALFVVILGFEFLMFRYVGRRGSSTTGMDGTRGTNPAAGTDPARSGSTTGEAGPRGEPADDVRACPECGTANDDAVMVQYCRHCLARLR